MNSKITTYIFFFESLALVNSLVMPAGYKILTYYIIHSIPSALSAYTAYVGMPKKKRDKKSVILFFFIAFYLGTVGIIAVLLIAYFLLRISKNQVSYNYELVNLDLLLDTQTINSPKWGEGRVRKILSKGNANVEEKLLALKIITSSIENLPFVYKFLNEPDDSRLYAYSFLSSLEKLYQNRISSLEQRVKEDEDPNLLVKLAQTYYEFIISGLVVPELKEFYIKKALDTLERAYSKLGKREDVILLMGKIYKSLGDMEKASTLLYEVYRYNPTSDNAIELCESLFKLKRYEEIKRIFRELTSRVSYTNKLPIVKVWVNEER